MHILELLAVFLQVGYTERSSECISTLSIFALGNLDVDDTDGFGPEIYSMPTPRPGLYRVAVNAYRIDGIPTTATVQITVGGSLTEFSGSYTFTSEDFNDTNGNPAGANPAAFWNTHTFEIGDLSIVEVKSSTTTTGLAAGEAAFTTASGENEITVTVDAPESIPDDSIKYEINEVNEDFEVDTSSLSGRVVTFQAAHKPLLSLTSPDSMPLEYEIVAFTLNEEGERDLESPPVRIKQDVRSQIRQEYVDKRDFFPGFARTTPARNDIIDASQFVQGTGNFAFSELAAWSDYPGLGVIDDSVNIANAVRTAWGKPLLVTSGWRNPRRNDGLNESSINSFHQTGDAVDLNPSFSENNWPDSVPGCLDPPGKAIESYAEAQEALTCLAEMTLNLTIYDLLFHANHLHIERDP